MCCRVVPHTRSRSVGELQLRFSHRVALYDKQANEVTHIVAQSDVIAWLLDQSQSGRLGALSSATVAQCGWLRPVITVEGAMPTVAALACMLNAGVSAAGVVDEDGVLWGNLSISDVRRLSTPTAFLDLALPVRDFLRSEMPSTPHPLGGAAAAPRTLLVSCSSDSIFQSVLMLLHRNAVHHCYVLDDKRRAVGIVSLSDVLHLVAA